MSSLKTEESTPQTHDINPSKGGGKSPKKIVILLNWKTFLLTLAWIYIIGMALWCFWFVFLDSSVHARVIVKNELNRSCAVTFIGKTPYREVTKSVLLNPNEQKHVVLFGCDNYEPENWKFIGIVFDFNGNILDTHTVAKEEFALTTWIIQPKTTP